MFLGNVPNEILKTSSDAFIVGISEDELTMIGNNFEQYEDIEQMTLADLLAQISHYCRFLFSIDNIFDNFIHGIFDTRAAGVKAPKQFQYLFFAMRKDELITEKTMNSMFTYIYSNLQHIPWKEFPALILGMRLRSEMDQEVIQKITENYESSNKECFKNTNLEQQVNETEDTLDNTHHYIYKLPNLITLMHIPACQGKVFEGYNHHYYLESEQMLQDFLDEMKEPVTKYQIKISDMEDFYKHIPKETEQMEVTDSVIEY